MLFYVGQPKTHLPAETSAVAKKGRKVYSGGWGLLSPSAQVCPAAVFLTLLATCGNMKLVANFICLFIFHIFFIPPPLVHAIHYSCFSMVLGIVKTVNKAVHLLV